MKTSTDFEKLVRKNKRRSRIKTIALSVVVALASLGLIVKGLTEMASSNGNRVKEHYLLMSEIAYPNISYNNWYFNATSNYTGQFHSDRFKNIDGIEVPYEQMEANYSLGAADLEDSAVWLTTSTDGKSSYTHTNLYKSPMFYNVNHDYVDEDYSTRTNDIDLTSQMTGQAIEMAITFDKAYTYEEIQKMIPDNLLINWYWIGSNNKYDTAGWTPDRQLGISSYDSGKLNENDFSQFRKNLQAALDNGYLDSTESMTDSSGKTLTMKFQDVAKNYLKNNKAFKTATFSGVILTGRAENFAQLNDQSWVYASNIGQTVQIQPYHTLTK